MTQIKLENLPAAVRLGQELRGIEEMLVFIDGELISRIRFTVTLEGKRQYKSIVSSSKTSTSQVETKLIERREFLIQKLHSLGVKV